MPTLYLIDGYAQFFRAYHAIRSPLTSPVTKEPTNMTYGFVGMMLKLLRTADRTQDSVALALDVGGDRGTFRSRIDPAYKANRPPPPEDLGVQVDRCLGILKDLGVPVLAAEGFEADDVIATVVSRLRRERPGLRIRIVSKDKDLKPLLESGRVELYDIHNDQAITAESVEAELGVKPAQMKDVLTLTGDTIDNVPGVEGVGEKTAAALIRQYGTLDNLLAHAADVPGKRGERLREWAPKSDLTRRLIELRTDVPLEFDVASARADGLALRTLIPACKVLGFNRFQDEARALMGGTGDAPEASAAGAAQAPMPEAAFESLRARGEKPAEKSTHPRAAEPSAFGTLFADVAAATPRQAEVCGVASACLTDADMVRSFLAKVARAGAVAIDTETTGVSPMRAELCGVSLAFEPGSGVYIPVRSPTPERHLDQAAALSLLAPMLQDPTMPKVGHNIKFDLVVLRAQGVRVRGVAEGGFDSMVASYLLDSARSSHSLDAVAQVFLGRGKQSIRELIGAGKDQLTFDRVPIEAATPYAADDAALAIALREAMAPELRKADLLRLFSEVEMPLVEVLAEMEFNGITVDADELERQRRRLAGRIGEILGTLDHESLAAVGRKFDPDSPKQLAALLFNKTDQDPPGLGLKATKKTKTGYSTDAEVLEELSEDPATTTPIPGLVLEYRQFSKLVSTYLVALRQEINAKTGRVHTSFHQTVAATGRLASSDPNLQNIPIRTEAGRDIRRAFVAAPGTTLVTADYSQIELRLLAHLSRDPGLIRAFERGEDIHAQVAAQIHGVPIDRITREQRAGAKMVNFGIVYGITAFGLAKRLGVDNAKAQEIIDAYKKRFAGITTFLAECVDQARRHGYVETILKRRRPIPDIESRQPARRAFAERTAINSVVQGSAADLIKLAMVAVHRELTSGPLAGRARMLLQIHDELVLEADESAADEATSMLVSRMEGAMALSVPIRVEAHAGRTWFEGK